MTWLAGAKVLQQLLFGYDGHGEAVGQVLDGQTGVNVFQAVNHKGVPNERKSYARPFRVAAREPSGLDGHPATVLDFSGTDSLLFRGLIAEVRCVSKELCLGLVGFRISNGIRNGAPFLLFQRPGVSWTASEARRAVAAGAAGMDTREL